MTFDGVSWVETEADFARRMGITRLSAKKARRDNLIVDVDVGRACGQIWLSQSGVDKLEALIGSGEGGSEGVAEKTRHNESSQELEMVARVLRRFAINTRIIDAVFGDAVIRVRVMDSGMFVPGMEIPVKKTGTGSVWLLACPQPRVKGRLPWKRSGRS